MGHVLAATLPSWLDSDRLRNLAIGAIVGFVIIELLVARFVAQLVVKAVLLAVIAGLAVAVWVQRDNLAACAKTCECRFFGQEVVLPKSAQQVCNTGHTAS